MKLHYSYTVYHNLFFSNIKLKHKQNFYCLKVFTLLSGRSTFTGTNASVVELRRLRTCNIQTPTFDLRKNISWKLPRKNQGPQNVNNKKNRRSSKKLKLIRVTLTKETATNA